MGFASHTFVSSYPQQAVVVACLSLVAGLIWERGGGGERDSTLFRLVFRLVAHLPTSPSLLSLSLLRPLTSYLLWLCSTLSPFFPSSRFRFVSAASVCLSVCLLASSAG
ncbi:hypothetical protein P167DRAFT_538407 [Morchella conica CCBAS932]|uniref:Uncharacterized protein n=1 Tax=Morchella conica CCBAS932 TaxID=1392247 RepID=A0A3N4KMJ4_9PEZI|nr:hypothetical protein P167DRAFT_538407 [Morchella conica CCBAS932]